MSSPRCVWSSPPVYCGRPAPYNRGDLGPISANWFEELTAEAAESRPKLCDHDGRRVDVQDDNLFKTPKHKLPNYSQLESTPTIFKEQSLCSPLFLSPTKGPHKNRIVSENIGNVNQPERSPCDATQLLPNEVFGSSSRCLSDSPAVMKEMFKTPFWDKKYLHRTPQRDGRIEICDSLFCTPKLIRNQTPSGISESLGAEADPDMSWSSSLATPPSPTVIIAQANAEASRIRIFDKKDAVIVQSLFSKLENDVGAASLAPPPDAEMDNDLHRKTFADSTAADKTDNCAVTSSHTLKAQREKTVLNAIKDQEACQVVENVIEGMEEVLSIFFTSEKPPGMRKVKIDSRIKRKNRLESGAHQTNPSLLGNAEEQNSLLPSEKPPGLEDYNKYSKPRQGNEHDLHKKVSSNRELSLSYEWSPLNLPDSNATQEENLPVGYGDANKMESSTCDNSQQHEDGSGSQVCRVPTGTCVSDLHRQERGVLNKEHEATLAHISASKAKNLEGLGATMAQSSPTAANCNSPWKNSDTANQKAKTVLSTLKRPTKFLYSLNNVIHRQDSGRAKDIDRILYRGPSSSSEKPDAQIGGSPKTLNLQGATCTHSQSEVKLVAKEDGEVFNNDRDLKEMAENPLNINQADRRLHAAEPLYSLHAHPTDTRTHDKTSSIKRRVTAAAGGLARRRLVADSLSCSELGDLLCNSAVLTHNHTKENVLGSDVTGDLDINHDTQGKPENNCSDLHPARNDLQSVTNTPGDFLCKTNMQDFGGFKTAGNKRIHISEENLRKGELLFKDDKSLCLSSHTALKTGDNKGSLETTANLDPASAVTFMGFKTASHKEIIVTECNIAKGSLLFQDIEDEINQNPVKGCETNLFDQFPKPGNVKPDKDETASRTEASTSKNLGEMSSEEGKEENQKADVTGSYKQSPLAGGQTNSDMGDQSRTSQTIQSIKKNTVCSLYCIPAEINKRKLLGFSTEIPSPFCDILTESQKAEVNELSSILENADSQFDFTQFKKMTLNNENIQSPIESIGESEKLNSSDVWKDVDFNDSFAAGGEYIENHVLHAKLASESKNDTDTPPCASANNTLSNSLKHKEGTYGGFSLASGRCINIAKDGLVKAIELFRDLDAVPQLSNHLPKDGSKRAPEPNSISISETLNGPHVLTDCNTGIHTVKGISHIVNPDSVESHPEIKKKGLSHKGYSEKEEDRMLNREKHYFKKFNSTELKNSNIRDTSECSVCPELEAECVQNCDLLSNGYGKLASAACASALPVGFATGKGKLININKAYLEKAKTIFNDILDPSIICEDQYRAKVAHGTSDSLITANADVASHSSEGKGTRELAIDKPPVVFIAAREKAAAVSHDSLQKAGQRPRKEVAKEACLPPQDISISKMVSFSTAGGKPVQLSDESLKRAREMFAEMDDRTVTDQKTTGMVWADSTLRQSGEEQIKSSSMNTSSLQDVQKNPVQGKDPDVDLPTLGFSTASGKTVAVSHDSLHKARLMFADADVESDVGHRVQSTQAKSGLSNQAINKDCGLVLDSSEHSKGIQTSIAKVTRRKPALNPNAAGPCSEGVSSVAPLAKLADKQVRKEVLLPKLNVPTSKITLFGTAGGQPVQLSDESLKKAEEMFADIDDEHLTDQENRDSVVKHSGEGKIKSNSLASSSLKHVQRKEPHVNLPPLGFNTASGKTVAVSRDSLQKARLMFANTDVVSDVGHKFQTKTEISNQKIGKGGGAVLDSSEDKTIQTIKTEVNQRKTALDQITTDPCCKGSGSSLGNMSDIEGVKEVCLPLQDIPNSKMPFFSTGHGNRVLLSDQEPHGIVWAGSIVKQNGKGKLKSSSLNSSNLEEVQRHAMPVKAPAVDRPTPAFSTASGKTVAVSYDSLQKAKLIFADTDDAPDTESKTITPNLEQGEENGSISALDTFPVNRMEINRPVDRWRPSTTDGHNSEGNESGKKYRMQVMEDGSMPRMPYFSTAGGKSVKLSEELLKKAREMFSEMDNRCSSQHDKPEGTLDNSSTWISGEKGSVKEMPVEGRVLKTPEIKNSPNAATKNLFGFSTASGKQVSVSESALQKVKGLFEEFSNVENVQENVRGNHDSIKVNVLTPILNKPEQYADSNMKLNDLQKDSGNTVIGDSVTAGSYDIPMSNIPLPKLGRHSTPLHAGTGIPSKLLSNLYFTSSQTPENDFEIEAAESAKAFMDDEDLTDAEIRADELFLCPDKPPNLRNGKRLRSDDGLPRGEPPIKRQLLPEFDRSLENESKLTLKPLTSSPHGHLRDRRMLSYNVSLKPLSCDPTSFSKGNKDGLVSKHTTASHFKSKSSVFQGLAANPTDASANHRSQSNNMSSSKTVTSTFVPPFKKRLCMSSDDQTKDPTRHDSDNAKEREAGTSHLGNQNNESDCSHLIPNLHCARDMQEMRIRKKQRQKIKPHPGSLYPLKTSSADRIPLVSAVQGRRPNVYTKTQLYRFGVMKNYIGINSESAGTFEFHCVDYFTRESLLSGGGAQIADGGWLVPTDKLTAGRLEFYRALCDTLGVDPKLISPEWVYNHYRWIVWKLAAMEVMFPEVFASRCLTPDRVLLQLKYRYDVEIDRSHRSAIRKIMERDDTPAKTLVLCISKIISQESEASDTKQMSAVIEVTDGWYGIKALLDAALTSLLRRGRLFIGQKIIVHGAELVGSDDACTPLEAPESIMLKIAANSTRPACWYTRLGYFHDPRPFCLRLSSLFAGGGVVGCVDVVLQRIYPMQWMEKMGNGTYVFRNDRAEEREAERHSAKQQKNLEVLFVKMQEEFDQQEACARRKMGPKRRSLSGPQICALQDGAEIYEAIQNEPDPGYLESCLSSEQLRALNHHRQILNDKKQAQIQAEFRKAIESADQGAGGCTRRDVTPVWKMRIVDYRDWDTASAYILNIWRPLPDVVSLLKEGCRFKMYRLAVSQSKSKSEVAGVQLTATKKTQFQQLQSSQSDLEQIYTERQVTEFSRFLEPDFTAAYREVDVVGLVISTQQKSGAAPMVYLSDETLNVIAVKFWTDLGQLSLEELAKPCTFMAASNLRWRFEFISGIPIVFAGDLSLVVTNPKDHHLQKAIQKLRHSIKSVRECCSEAEMKLMNILQVHHPEERRSLGHCSVDPHFPIAAGSRCSTLVPKIGKPQMNCMYTPDGNNTSSTSSGVDVKTCKKMKGLDFLTRIPSPPPLTPARALVSPSLERAFLPPRSLQTEVIKSGQLVLKTSTKTPMKAEGGFVADEELAMINTQALVSCSAEGTANRTASNADLQKEGNSPNPSDSRCTTSADTDKTMKTKEPNHSIYQGQLCRKRRHKL